MRPVEAIIKEAEKFPIKVIGDMVIEQGKYKGRTVAVAAQDAKYLKWVKSHTDRGDFKWCLLHIYKEKIENIDKNELEAGLLSPRLADPDPGVSHELEERVSQLEDVVFSKKAKTADSNKCTIM